MLLSILAVSVYSDSVKHDNSKPMGHHDFVKEVSSLVAKVAPKVKPSVNEGR